jgi:ribonuclease Z
LFELNLQIEEIYPQRPREIITVLDNKEFVVSAGALFHRVPCLGYVFHERDSKPQIDMAKVAALHVKPGPVLKQLKNGHSITLPSGQIIRPRDVLLPGRKGRKVVVLGDTADSSSLTEVARDADLLLHECTLPLALQSEARIRGHSTAGMAGVFARQIRAKNLLLTHFSPRFTTVADYAGLAAEARSAFCSSNVLLAQDFLTVSLARHAAGSAESVDDDDKMFAKQAHAGDDLDVPDEFL